MTKRKDDTSSYSLRGKSQSSKKKSRKEHQNAVSSSPKKIKRKYQCSKCGERNKIHRCKEDAQNVVIGYVDFHKNIADAIKEDPRFISRMSNLIRMTAGKKQFDTLAAALLKVALFGNPSLCWDITGCEFHLGNFDNIAGNIETSRTRRSSIQFKQCSFENSEIDNLNTVSMQLIERLYRESLEHQEEMKETNGVHHLANYIDPRHFKEQSYVGSIECSDKTETVYPIWHTYALRNFIHGKVTWSTYVNESGETVYFSPIDNSDVEPFYVYIQIKRVKGEWQIVHLSSRLLNDYYSLNVHITNGFIVVVTKAIYRSEHHRVGMKEELKVKERKELDPDVYESISDKWEKRCLAIQESLNVKGFQKKSSMSFDDCFFHEADRCTKFHHCDPLVCFVAIPVPLDVNTVQWTNDSYHDSNSNEYNL